MARLVRIVNSIYALGKRLVSYRKSDWALSDYPVRLRTQVFDPKLNPTRFTQHKYLAYIVNWHLSGTGNTRDEAMRDLTAKFENARAEKETLIPRPGITVPIQFASKSRIEAHPELAEDFIHQILGCEWAWITDESTLWDFHGDETNDVSYKKILEVYGVDVSDIESAKLSEILDRIAGSARTDSYNHSL